MLAGGLATPLSETQHGRRCCRTTAAVCRPDELLKVAVRGHVVAAWRARAALRRARRARRGRGRAAPGSGSSTRARAGSPGAGVSSQRVDGSGAQLDHRRQHATPSGSQRRAVELQAGIASPAAVRIGKKSTSNSADAPAAQRPAGNPAGVRRVAAGSARLEGARRRSAKISPRRCRPHPFPDPSPHQSLLRAPNASAAGAAD